MCMVSLPRRRWASGIRRPCSTGYFRASIRPARADSSPSRTLDCARITPPVGPPPEGARRPAPQGGRPGAEGGGAGRGPGGAAYALELPGRVPGPHERPVPFHGDVDRRADGGGAAAGGGGEGGSRAGGGG